MVKNSDKKALVVARLFVDFFRTSSEEFAVQLRASPDVFALAAALYVGQLEGRPMSASKVATYIRIPRPTVIRKLKLLHEYGIVAQDSRKRWRIAVEKDDIRAHADKITDSRIKHFHKAISEMSKLDSERVVSLTRPTYKTRHR